ncbi:hypothetical protein C8R43DRAFT_1102118 [Mycena crocata]|nr:hypothetical protein C8R43DRAFT_1102118 [Mycena crocata]
MAAPFVFVPEASSSTPYSAGYHNPYYATPHGGPSPFLPPSPLPYPSSPYLGPVGGPGTSPNAFHPDSALWPDDTAHYESPYTASWTPHTPRRQRTNSWHGAAVPPTSPFLSPHAPAFLHTNSSPYFTRGHKKTNSWGNHGAEPPSWWGNNTANPYVSPQVPQQIHPWLNGDAPSPIFSFDLSEAGFLPLRLVSPQPQQHTLASTAELCEPAFHPPRTSLRILHPRLPFWPIDLALTSANTYTAPPPITLGDILVALHRELHRRITPADWAALSPEDAGQVTQAFARRCRAEAFRSGVHPTQLRDHEIAARNDGVKRVDFLVGKTMFKGLVRVPGDPEGCVRMLTA